MWLGKKGTNEKARKKAAELAHEELKRRAYRCGKNEVLERLREFILELEAEDPSQHT